MPYYIDDVKMEFTPGPAGDTADCGYSLLDFFRKDWVDQRFDTLQAAYQWLRQNYRGPDSWGIGVDFSHAVHPVDG